MIRVIIFRRMGEDQIRFCFGNSIAQSHGGIIGFRQSAIRQIKQDRRAQPGKTALRFTSAAGSEGRARVIAAGSSIGGNNETDRIATITTGRQRPVKENFNIIGMCTDGRDFQHLHHLPEMLLE